jgi:hypothetical protein
MSRLSRHSKKVKENKEFNEQKVTNFMGGNSYKPNPLETLKIVATSSIFGEPSYYRNNKDSKRHMPRWYSQNQADIVDHLLKDIYDSSNTTDDVFTKCIRESLDFDFAKTVEFAVALRHEYNMRLNPAVIYIEASISEHRANFNEQHPGRFREIGKKIINRPDDMKNMFDYYMYLKGDKKGLPSVVKRVWASELQNMEAYHANKYKSKGLIDLIRISHPKKTKVIDELMSTGKVTVSDEETTWEQHRSNGMKWNELLNTIQIPHMALLRNLRGIFSEVDDIDICKNTLEKLKNGVKKGRQFPFRYYSAYKAISNASAHHKGLIQDALEECIDIAMDNFPKLNGKVMSLCDNSGSAHGSFTSEFGTVTVSDIANLSAVMTGYNADEGHVGVFGDTLKTETVSKRNDILSQHKNINNIGRTVGGGTENGVWLFWDQAIKNKEHWDHVFIYSDMQAGHGGLYGCNSNDYSNYIHPNGGGWNKYIDVLKLVQDYRRLVNPKVNVYTVQVAGYDNNVLPHNLYRTAILSGWTGKEVLYASKMNDLWNQIEQQ